MKNKVRQMKWWGWGSEKHVFNMEEKPGLWPYIKKTLEIKDKPTMTPPVKERDIVLPELRINDGFLNDIRTYLREDQFISDRHERIVHTYGKSFRDLWRIRHGIVKSAPDLVIYPESEDDVAAIVKAAAEHNIVLITFGGGSNIAGSLEAKSDGRMIVSLDMKRMNRVLEVSHQSRTARIQGGVLGPHMEEQLNEQAVTLGHFPDSFEYSTLGGWIATRSAGMQSDKYGKIEDMVISLRMVTPSGTIVTRDVPKSSNGIDIKHICIGSEGILGIITEALLQIHPLPEYRKIYGYIFPDFASGLKAVRECEEKEWKPMLMRLSDAGKTELSFAYKSKSGGLKHFFSRAVQSYLKDIKKFDLSKTCLMLAGFEGNKEYFTAQKKQVNAIYKKHGAVNLGTGPGQSFEKGKYDFPYLRDYVMDRNIMADVAETSTVWGNVLPLYEAGMKAIETSVNNTGKTPFSGCHISHTYRSGASLYFTFGCEQIPGRELEQYLYVKKSIQDAFLQNGGTLSHHHAVGTEHLPWIEQDLSTAGLHAVKALKEGLDPQRIMNPGKIVPDLDSQDDWGLSEEDIVSFDKGAIATDGAPCDFER